MSSFVKWLSTYDSQPAQAGPAPLLLDAISSVAAYSVRKLRTAYAGACMRVRRSSDNAEADIGFDGSGNLDTTALLAHVGAGSGYIRTWYDQSGNARNAGQATAGYQARIVNAGVVDARPVFDGANDYFVFATSITLTSFSAFIVDKHLSVRDVILIGGIFANVQIRENRTSTGNLSIYAGNETISPQAASGFDSLHTVAFHKTGTSLAEFEYNGVSKGSLTSPIDSSFTLEQISSLQNLTYPSLLLAGEMGELVLLGAVASANDRTNIQASQKSYFGTP
jgi:hypothetical protein